MFNNIVLSIGGIGGTNNKTEAAVDSEMKKLLHLLQDDATQVLSSFQLNQIASLTFGAKHCDAILELLESVLSSISATTPLTLEKALVVTKHVLIFGSELAVNCASQSLIGKSVEQLQSYNTVLLAQQQQQQHAASIFLRIKGGSVDRGGPVRVAACAVAALLQNHDVLRHERLTNADPNSLVPVGSSETIAYCSDEIRLLALQKRMQQQMDQATKSNLTKADSSFGGGYSATNGKAVVGAAHGLDEMMRAAAREKQAFSDDGTGRGYVAPSPELGFALQQQQQQQHQSQQQPSLSVVPVVHVPQADLLDFCSTETTAAVNTTATNDLLGGTTGDLLGAMDSTTAAAPFQQYQQQQQPAMDIFDSFAPSNDTTSVSTTADLLGSMTVTSDLLPTSSAAHVTGNFATPAVMTTTSAAANMPPPSSVMGSNAMADNRFAALDALAGGAGGSSSDSRSLSMQSSQDKSLSSLAGLGIGGLSTQSAATTTQSYALSSLKVSTRLAPGGPLLQADNNDASENGFVMGGATGAGLEPTGAAPAAAPPPPPPGASGLW